MFQKCKVLLFIVNFYTKNFAVIKKNVFLKQEYFFKMALFLLQIFFYLDRVHPIEICL
jgi:hypothetical protein